MHRLPLLFALVTLFVTLVLKKLNADKPLRITRKVKLSICAKELARKMLDSMNHQQVTIKTSKTSWPGADVVGKKCLALPPSIAESNTASDHGYAALRVGLYLVGLQNPAAIARRRWALRFGHVFPIFVTIVTLFAIVALKTPVLLGISIIMASLGLAACAQILTLTAELQAASLVSIVLEKKHILPRLTDEEAIITATRAQAWNSIVPGFISRLM